MLDAQILKYLASRPGARQEGIRFTPNTQASTTTAGNGPSPSRNFRNGSSPKGAVDDDQIRDRVNASQFGFSLRLSRSGLLAAAPVDGQTDRKVTTLAEGVYEIQHKDALDGSASGNTTVIIGDRQVLVVDSCFLPSAAREDIAQIRQWTDKPVAFVLNTHFHNDHNLGNRAYMDTFPSLTIIAHAETKKDMDMFGPGSASREERGVCRTQANARYRQDPRWTAVDTGGNKRS